MKTFRHPYLAALLLHCGLVLTLNSRADSTTAETNVQHFDNYSVHYTVFNSTFLLEQVAKTYQLKRSKYESILNISVVPRGESFGGLATQLSGTATNLMQQQKRLNFKKIDEGNVVYYLAPVRINGEEVMHFDIRATPENADTTLQVKFTKKLYSD